MGTKIKDSIVVAEKLKTTEKLIAPPMTRQGNVHSNDKNGGNNEDENSGNEEDETHHEEHKVHIKASNKLKVVTSLICGAVAGAVAKTVIAPLDRTKINFQVSNKPFSWKEALDFIKSTKRNEGLPQLWRGNSATMVRIVPYAAIQYTAHEQYKQLLKTDPTKQHLPHHLRFLAGAMAGVTSSAITYPLDLVRARMAVTGKDKYANVFQVLKKTTRSEGLLALYRGCTPTVMGSGPYSGTSFFVYETLKKVHADRKKGQDPRPWERMIMGAIAGLCGQTASYPLDIIRRRMQTAGVTNHYTEYRSIRSTFKYVWKEEGIKGFYKGLSMNWIKGPIAVGTSFMVYDITLFWVRRLFHTAQDDDGG